MKRLLILILSLVAVGSILAQPIAAKPTFDSAWVRWWGGDSTTYPRLWGDSWQLAPWHAVRAHCDTLIADWDTSMVKVGYLLDKTNSGDTVTVKVDSAGLAALLYALGDTLAFHHDDTSDMGTCIYKTSGKESLDFSNKLYTGELHVWRPDTGTRYKYGLDVTGAGVFRLKKGVENIGNLVNGAVWSVWDSTTSWRANTYREGFEVLDTLHQTGGDSIPNPARRAYMGYAYADLSLNDAIPYAHIAQYESCQARIGADTLGNAEVVAIGSSAGKWSDTSYMTPTAIYTTGNVTADTFKGDGSLLTGISSAADSDFVRVTADSARIGLLTVSGWTLPTDSGQANYVLTSQADGTTSWQPHTSGGDSTWLYGTFTDSVTSGKFIGDLTGDVTGKADDATGADSASLADSAKVAADAHTADLADSAVAIPDAITGTSVTITGRDSAQVQKASDSMITGQLTVANASAIANVGNTAIVTNTPAVGTVTQYGTGLSDITWHTSSYAGHNTADTFFVAVQYAGATDTFKWKQGRSGTYAKWLATTSKKAMAVGCSLTLAAATGHTLNDSWMVPVSAPVPLVVKHSNGTIFGKVFPDGATQWGYGNTASGLQAVVGGGTGNTASGNYATVGGGAENIASGTRSTVAGGYVGTASGSTATVGGGYANAASGGSATISGGYVNTAKGDYAIIPGGIANLDSAPYSFALGCSTRVPAADSFSGVFGFGAGSGRLVGRGKRSLTFGIQSPGFGLYWDDSLKTEPNIKFISGGQARFDSLATFAGAVSADSVATVHLNVTGTSTLAGPVTMPGGMGVHFDSVQTVAADSTKLWVWFAGRRYKMELDAP